MGTWNAEKRRAYEKARYKTHGAAKRRRQKRYYQQNKAKYILTARRWAEANPERRLIIARKSIRAYFQRYKAIVNSFKKRPCQDCEHEYPPYVMDFDHVRGVKLFDIATAAAKRRSIDRVMEEIAKCDLVCANCHRERTQQRLGSCR